MSGKTLVGLGLGLALAGCASFMGWVRRTYPSPVSGSSCAAPAYDYDAVCDTARCSSQIVGPTAARAEQR